MLDRHTFGRMTDTGHAAEDFIGAIASEALFADFVHLRPTAVVNGQQRELCDLLIVLDEQAIAFEIKSQASQRDGGDEHDWFRKNLKKAASQLSGASRMIPRAAITATNRIGQSIAWQPGQLKMAHGVALFQVDGRHAVPNTVARRSKSGAWLQFLSFTDFMNIARHLGTFPDVVDYFPLDHKYRSGRHRMLTWNRMLMATT